MSNQANESRRLMYDKCASALFGYIFSIVKNESQAKEILIKTFTKLTHVNPKEEKILIEGIRVANRTILEITKKERQSLLKVLEK